MKKSAKMMFAAIVALVVMVSCEPEPKTTATTTPDKLKIDSATFIKSDVDSTGNTIDSTANH